DDGSGFPYKHCAALSVAKTKEGRVTGWGTASAETRKEAEFLATQQCGQGKACAIREWVCT
ncbi:MAG: DUF4189 domain-containing protein, partial [Brucella intermedia]